MKAVWQLGLLSLVVCCEAKKFGVDKVPAGYSFSDPQADHTTVGIALDEGNKRDLALKAFRAAMRYSPSETTYGNLVRSDRLHLPCW